MTKEYRYGLIILAFCGVFTDFLVAHNNGLWFPRDRIIHLIISFFIWIILVYILNEIDFNTPFVRLVLSVLIVFRLITLVINFAKYFQIFYGDSAIGIFLFTVIVVLLSYKLKKESTAQLSVFYLLLNVILALLVLILCTDKINIIILYSTDLSIDFSLSKIIIYPDIIILLFMTKKEDRLFAGKYLLLISTLFVVTVIIMQGLCIGGELLYSISPLQSLVQIFTGTTIKRYDFILNFLFTINYFGAVIFNVAALKLAAKQGEEN